MVEVERLKVKTCESGGCLEPGFVEITLGRGDFVLCKQCAHKASNQLIEVIASG